MMIKAVVFDFDGTLVNTVDDVIRCFNEALISLGFPKKEEDYIRGLIGKNLDDIVQYLLPCDKRSSDNIQLVKDKYRSIYMSDSKPNTLPYPGIDKLLHELKNKNIKIVINSNKSQSMLEKMSLELFENIEFDSIVGYQEGLPSKPDPYGIKEYMKRINVSSEEMVYVGDSEIDILTANNLNCPCILVPWGIGDMDLLKKKYTIYLAENANDITRYISQEEEK